MHGVIYITFDDWGVQAALDISNIRPLKVNKYSLLSAQSAKLRSSWRYNWLSLIHCSLVTRCEEDGTNGGRADIIRWARFSSGLNTETPAVTKIMRWVPVLSLQTVKQQDIICKHYWLLLNNTVSESTFLSNARRFIETITFWKVPLNCPFVLLVRETYRWSWVWNVGGMILTD